MTDRIEFTEPQHTAPATPRALYVVMGASGTPLRYATPADLRAAGFVPVAELDEARKDRTSIADAYHRALLGLDALRDQVARGGCAASGLGETVYRCRTDELCGLCRLRHRAEAAEREIATMTPEYIAAAGLRAELDAMRERAEKAEAVAEHWKACAAGAGPRPDLERTPGAELIEQFQKMAPNAFADFDPPGREYTVGDALGLRRDDAPEEREWTLADIAETLVGAAEELDGITELTTGPARYLAIGQSNIPHWSHPLVPLWPSVERGGTLAEAAGMDDITSEQLTAIALNGDDDHVPSVSRPQMSKRHRLQLEADCDAIVAKHWTPVTAAEAATFLRKRERAEKAEAVASSAPGATIRGAGMSSHLDLIRSLPCATLRGDFPNVSTACSGATEAHHRKIPGLAVKAPDSEAFPLCLKHHRERHSFTGSFKSWTKAMMRDWERKMVEVYKPDEEVF
ncbi:MAG TPA: hypothetical protein VKO62_00100 [Solirubrobacterales bacterium]|nr:hypothetical protein [Solirubrobacterales bacterium]